MHVLAPNLYSMFEHIKENFENDAESEGDSDMAPKTRCYSFLQAHTFKSTLKILSSILQPVKVKRKLYGLKLLMGC